MILMRILPGVFKELSKHVPSVLFQAVDWGELASEIPKISRRILQREGYDDLYQQQKRLLEPYNILLTADPVKHAPRSIPKSLAEKWLILYFTQLFSHDGLFLDLRLEHFELDKETLKWHPSSLWVQFNSPFRQGLLRVYEGFYLENDEDYHQGLQEIGLLRDDFSEADKRELGDLFKKQFGKGLHEEISFELNHLRDSIIGMSHFMLNKKVKVSKDFLYLGIYLVTMYSALEKCDSTLPVKDIYLSVRGRFKAQENG
jgi:hypothetical protein